MTIMHICLILILNEQKRLCILYNFFAQVTLCVPFVVVNLKVSYAFWTDPIYRHMILVD